MFARFSGAEAEAEALFGYHGLHRCFDVPMYCVGCMLVLSLLVCYIAFHLHPIFCVFAFYRYPHLLDEYDDIFVRSFFNVTPLSLYILNEYESCGNGASFRGFRRR